MNLRIRGGAADQLCLSLSIRLSAVTLQGEHAAGSHPTRGSLALVWLLAAPRDVHNSIRAQ